MHARFSSCPALFILSAAFLLSALISLSLPACASDGNDAINNANPIETAATTREQPAIQDNSFLVEEAYNQEFGVVQHINTFMRSWTTHDWVYTFTQEWPAPGVTHQLSYTVSAVANSGFNGAPGMGDLALNYRYQLVGNGKTRIAVAPRISLLAPTGSPHFGRGFGGTGVQTNIPLSWVVAKHLVTHWNAGATIIPSARNEVGDHAMATGYNLGQSFIWLIHPRLNAMLETVWLGSESVVGPGQTQRSHDLLVNPGVRAFNFPSGLQVVPGISVPTGVGPSAGEKGIFLYLSFEHPFRKIVGK